MKNAANIIKNALIDCYQSIFIKSKNKNFKSYKISL